MSTPPKPPKTRRDGWTAERQLRFLDTLAATRSITKAAAAAGMSRETPYRLRKRREGALFAAAWDRVMKSHNPATLELAKRRRPVSKFGGNAPKITNPTNPTTRPPHRQLGQLRDPGRQAAAEFFGGPRAALRQRELAEKR